MRACCDLVQGLGAQIAGISVLIELEFLKGREQVKPYAVEAVLRY